MTTVSAVSFSATDLTRPRSLNAERSGHWREHRVQTDEDRQRWGWLWRTVLPSGLRVQRCAITAQPSYSSRPQDTGNCYPSVKAAVDALVDVGVLPDDSGAHVASIMLLAPLRGPDALTVTLVPVEVDL